MLAVFNTRVQLQIKPDSPTPAPNENAFGMAGIELENPYTTRFPGWLLVNSLTESSLMILAPANCTCSEAFEQTGSNLRQSPRGRDCRISANRKDPDSLTNNPPHSWLKPTPNEHCIPI